MTTLTLPNTHTSRCYILVGLPCTGKSFWTDTILNGWKGSARPAVLSEDDLIYEECERTGESFNVVAHRKCAKETHEELMRKFYAAVGVNRTIIVDGRNLSEADRSVFLIGLPDNYQKIGIFFTAPNRIMLERMQKREDETGRHTPPSSLAILQKRLQKPGQFEFFRTTTIDHTCVYS